MFRITAWKNQHYTWIDVVAVSITILVLTADRFFVVQESDVTGLLHTHEFMLLILLVATHGWCVASSCRNGRSYVAYVVLLFFGVLFAVAIWESGTMVATFAVYLLIVGKIAVGPRTLVPLGVLWVTIVVTLLSYDSAVIIHDASTSTAARGLIYLVVLVWISVAREYQILERVDRQAGIIGHLKSSVEELSAANTSYNTFIQVAESQAARLERARITREIHDGVGYALTNLIMLAESAKDIVAQDSHVVLDRLSSIRNQARLALSDTRRALRELRHAEQTLAHGEPALIHMLEVFERATGVSTRYDSSVRRTILEDQRIFPVVYRFVQEALTNSFHHGHASNVEIRASYTDAQQLATAIVVTVADNGSPTEIIQEGIGLHGMRERLGEIGGELDYHTLNGFTVIARIPLDYGEAEDA